MTERSSSRSVARGRASRVALAAWLAVPVACASTLPAPPTVPATAEEGPHGRLLLHPEPDPTRLLGRAVTRSADGAITIADAIAPGCDVRIVREPASYTFRREVDLREATAIGAGVPGVAALEARYGQGTEARIEATNLEVARADLAGPCGAEVIDEVLVGTGRRFLLRDAALAAELGGVAFGGTARAGRTTEARILDEVRWDRPAAYAYRTREMAGAARIDVEVSVPAVIEEGQAMELGVVTSAPAFLFVYAVGADEHVSQLLPSNEEPVPATHPGVPFTVPTEAMRRAGVSLVAALRAPGTVTREQLVVVAFRERGDFDLVRERLEGTHHLGMGMGIALEEIPRDRWRKRIASYEIVPQRPTVK